MHPGDVAADREQPGPRRRVGAKPAGRAERLEECRLHQVLDLHVRRAVRAGQEAVQRRVVAIEQHAERVAISGGAQRRTRLAVLQHGTIIVDRDEHRLSRIFRTPIDTVCARVTSLHLEDLAPSRSAITDAVVAGFTETFGPLAPLAWSDVPAPPQPIG